MKNKIYIAVAAALVALGVGYLAFRVSEEPAVVEVTPAEQLGGALLEKTQNPLKDELPSANPFKNAETNPFIDAYKNPF